LKCLSFSYIDRVQRLKDARSEAAKEIEELKAQKNTEYQNSVAQVRKDVF
jgi:vacuolar-type H+-ATPase subunit H